MRRKTPHILILIILIALAILYFYYRNESDNLSKCPENYTEDNTGTEEYRNALINWTAKFFKANPNATISDWSIAKLKLWEDNNCTIALERSKLSGNVSDLKPWELVDYEVQKSLDKAINKTN